MANDLVGKALRPAALKMPLKAYPSHMDCRLIQSLTIDASTSAASLNNNHVDNVTFLPLFEPTVKVVWPSLVANIRARSCH